MNTSPHLHWQWLPPRLWAISMKRLTFSMLYLLMPAGLFAGNESNWGTPLIQLSLPAAMTTNTQSASGTGIRRAFAMPDGYLYVTTAAGGVFRARVFSLEANQS